MTNLNFKIKNITIINIKTFYQGTIAFLTADNLGANSLGGFAESFSASSKIITLI